MDTDLTEKIKKLLEDPEMMKRATGMAQMLKESGALESVGEKREGSPQQAVVRAEGAKRPAGGVSGKDHIRLLQALLPYFGETYREKIKLIVKLLESYDLAQGMGLFG